MARLWKRIDGEPYMINPRLGVLALQALNPPEKKRRMARKHGARHMAWVRSFRKNARHHRRRHRRNPYPLAGSVAALGNPRRRHHRKHNPHRRRRHYRHNPPAIIGRAKTVLGLPGLMPVLYGAGGFIGTAAVQGFVDTLVPASWKTNTDGTPSMLTKYGEIVISIAVVSYVGKLIAKGGATMAAVGGGIYAVQQAAHDFASGLIPGMHAYTPLKAYTPIRVSSTMGRFGAMRSTVAPSAEGQMPQLATRWGMPQLAAQAIGQVNVPVAFAADGAMNLQSTRFRRFA